MHTLYCVKHVYNISIYTCCKLRRNKPFYKVQAEHVGRTLEIHWIEPFHDKRASLAPKPAYVSNRSIMYHGV